MQQYETGSSLQLRNLIRQRHAEWSEKTFGDVGPIGPISICRKKHLKLQMMLATSANGLTCNSCYGMHNAVRE